MTLPASEDSCVNVPMAFQSLSPDGRILDVNAQWEILTGYTAAELIDHEFSELVPEDYTERFLANLAELMRAGELSGADCFLRRKDGEIRNVQIFARVIDGGKRTSCMLVDVTSFRQTECALGESEERFRSMFELAPTPIVIHDGMAIIMANAACAAFLGYDSAEELVGVPVIDLVHPGDRALVAERVKRLITEDEVAPSTEERYLRKDGTVAYGDAIASSVVLDGRRVVYVISIDLADKLEAQRALEESEEHFRNLFEFSADGIVVHDGYVALVANRAALDNFGFPPGTDVAGLEVADFVHADSLSTVSERMQGLFDGGTEDTPVELTLRRADGTDWYAEVVSAPFMMGGRRVLQTTFRDQTERRRSEAELRRYREQLEMLLAARTESLQRTKQELDAVSIVISRTVEMRDPYTAGHQFRVTALSTAIARRLGMSDLEVEELEIAARLHDVGKVSVPTELLSKPARFTPVEYALVKSHADAGFEIISSAGFQGDIAEIIRQHHERLDGSGYPRGLAGDQLLYAAKVLMVADVVEAMSSHRPYRPSLGQDAAIAEIVSGRGVLFDSEVVDACVALFEEGFEFEEVTS